jgi:di/tricarboxylate transporter
MMPAGTAPNAIAVEVGGVRPADMAYAGLMVNLACALVAAAVSLWMVPWMTG